MVERRRLPRDSAYLQTSRGVRTLSALLTTLTLSEPRSAHLRRDPLLREEPTLFLWTTSTRVRNRLLTSTILSASRRSLRRVFSRETLARFLRLLHRPPLLCQTSNLRLLLTLTLPQFRNPRKPHPKPPPFPPPPPTTLRPLRTRFTANKLLRRKPISRESPRPPWTVTCPPRPPSTRRRS